jgi:serine/threonine protein kinase
MYWDKISCRAPDRRVRVSEKPMNQSEPIPGGPVENRPAREGTTPPPPRPPAGIPDHELLRLIGRGAYGEVWLARSITGEYRAVKVVYRSSFEQERPYEREFGGIRKFEPISRLHESQVDILHVGRNDAQGYFFYVMELADDASAGATADANAQASSSRVLANPATYQPRTLKSELLRRSRLPAAECVKLGLALTTALEHLHRNGLVHRDVKPSNIIFINGQPKLADIGLVTSVDATRSHVGTLGFAPPEGPGTVTGDLYSLGKVLYEAATARDRQEFPELPTRLGGTREEEAELLELNEVILKACDNEAKRRYQSAEAMRADLAVLDRGESLARKRRAGKRLGIFLKAGGVSVALALGAALIMRQQHFAADKRGYSIPAPTNFASIPIPTNLPSAKAAEEIPDSKNLGPSLFTLLRASAGKYPRLTLGSAGGSGLTKLRLNVHPIRWGNLYDDAIRFTTPPEKGLDLAWAFIHKPSKGFNGWWVMTVHEGSMQRGFQKYDREQPTRYENVPSAAGKVLYLQGLAGKWLEPNQDYLISFEFQDTNPVEFQIAMNFVPSEGATETNSLVLEKALGLVVKKDAHLESSSAGATNK